MSRLIPATLLAVATLFTPPLFADDLPVAISPTDAHLHYQGRWDTSNTAGPRCEWPGCNVTIKFHGTAANIKLKDSGHNYYQVVVDGKPADVLHPAAGESINALATDLPDADHTIELFRRTEANYLGVMQVEGFQLSAGGKILSAPKPAHSIEIIGDSISCGYGNEGTNQNEHFSPKTENNYMAYGAVAARYFDADYSCIAWSGRTMWPNNTVPEIYDLILPQGGKAKVDFAAASKPDVFVINLATNDFTGGNPDEEKWTGAYEAFIKHLREFDPNARIYVASGSMMNDGWPPTQKALSTLKSYLAKIVDDCNTAGDKNVKELDFAPQNGNKNGLGADWHPNVKTHEIMAETLEAAIEKDLHWKPAVKN